MCESAFAEKDEQDLLLSYEKPSWFLAVLEQEQI